MTIFEYMGMCPKERTCGGIIITREHCDQCIIFVKDGNLMVAAINKMRERGDWGKFDHYCWCNRESFTYSDWLFGSPSTFFRLMDECLKKGVIGHG